MFAKRSLFKSVINIQKRNHAGMLKKNLRVEENAGMREATYQTWKFDFKNTAQLFGILFIPSFFITTAIKHELTVRDAEAGIAPRGYGFWMPEGSLSGKPKY